MPTFFCFCLICRSGPLFEQVVPLRSSSGSCMSAVQIFIIVISVLLAVGILTCVLSHYKMGARSWSDQRNRQQPSARQLQPPCPQQQPYTYSLTPASKMYTPTTIQERQRLEAGAHHDHVVRLQSVQTDISLNLPHSIALPDGEEGPRCNTKHLKLRDSEQHAEITRSFIRPPPNRTVPDGNTMLPFRSNSVGLIQKPSMPPAYQVTDSAQAPLVTRSQSVSTSSASSGKLSFSRGLFTSVSSYHWLPSSGASGNSSRTNSCMKTVPESKYDSTGPPPPYSDVVNQLDMNTVSRQQNSGV